MVQYAIAAPGSRVKAGPQAPVTARCPECGGRLGLRSRDSHVGTPTWFYMQLDAGSQCSQRSAPWSYEPVGVLQGRVRETTLTE